MTDYYGEAQCYFTGCKVGAVFRLLSCYGTYGLSVALDSELFSCDEHSGPAWLDCSTIFTKWLPSNPVDYERMLAAESSWNPFNTTFTGPRPE